MPALFGVLVNPGVRLETARVFATLAKTAGVGNSAVFEPSAQLTTLGEWLAAITRCGNDLEAAAIGLAPVVRDAGLRLRDQAGCVLSRMTGSGTTVFGLFEDEAHAALAAANSHRSRAALVGPRRHPQFLDTNGSRLRGSCFGGFGAERRDTRNGERGEHVPAGKRQAEDADRGFVATHGRARVEAFKEIIRARRRRILAGAGRRSRPETPFDPSVVGGEPALTRKTSARKASSMATSLPGSALNASAAVTAANGTPM